MGDRKTITRALTKAGVGYWVKKGFGVTPEIGVLPWGRRRADLLAVNQKGVLVVCEVKSGLSDFRADKKYEQYLPHCNKMYFIVHDKDWIEPFKDTLKSQGIGILWLNPKTGLLKSILSAPHREMPKGNKKAIVLRIAWKASKFNKSNTKRYRVFL